LPVVDKHETKKGFGMALSQEDKDNIQSVLDGRKRKGFVGAWGGNKYIFDKRWERGRFKVSASMRGTKCMGRFGGGWNWNLGFQASKTTIIFNLLVMSIRVSWYKPKEQKQEVA